MTIRDTGSDFASDVRKKRDDPILKGEKDSKTGYQVTLPERDVGPSSTQVYNNQVMKIIYTNHYSCILFSFE